MIGNFEEIFKDGALKDKNGFYVLEPKKVKSSILLLKEKMDFIYLLDITATDYLKFPQKQQSRFAITYILRHKNIKDIIIIKSFLKDREAIESITDIFEGANWAEREVYDQYGVVFRNHPNLKRVLNHKDFVGHPLRKDYPITKGQVCTSTDDLLDELIPKLKLNGYSNINDFMLLNLGPSHPASHGTIRTLVALRGENIVSAVTEIGYLHRGFEKSCEQNTYNQIIPYTDRLNYCSAILNNIAFAHSVEQMLGIDIPDRAKFIRVIVGEISRVIDHLVCIGTNLVDMGALTNFWYLFNPRESVYILLSKLTGARLTNSYVRVGGLRYDLYDGFENDLKLCIDSIEKGIADSLKLIEKNILFLNRTQNVGVIDKHRAINECLGGPNLRACGIPYDLRKSIPYYFYDSFDFDVVIGSVGDVYDRVMVRFEEIRQSIKIIRQAIKNIPDGDISIDDHLVTLPKKENVYTNIEGLVNQFKLIFEGIKVPIKEHYSSIEAANGELGFYIVSDGSGIPYKVKTKAPSFYSMATYPKTIEGSLIADAVITLGSINIIAGEMDR